MAAAEISGIILAAAGSVILAALAASVAYDGIAKRTARKAIPALDRNWNRLTVKVAR